jgi:hypothetical protein
MKTKTIILRVPLNIYAELTVLEPGLIDSNGVTRYGGISGFFNNLLLEHIAKRRTEIRAASAPGGSNAI